MLSSKKHKIYQYDLACIGYFLYCIFITSYIISFQTLWKTLKNINLNLSFSLSVLSLSDRDGPDQNSPQIGQFSGNTALESVYSTSNQILIKFHSDFTTSGFFVLSYHGLYYLKVYFSFCAV